MYIRPEFHQRIARIVQVIGEDKISLYNYLDNVLRAHFEQYQEEITQSFERNTNLYLTMGKIIILLLIEVILLLLSDKMPIAPLKKNTTKPKTSPIPKVVPPTPVMGASKFVPEVKVTPIPTSLTENEQQDILREWNEEPTIDLEDEEEDLRSYRTEAEDNDFATGLSFEDLEKVATFLSEDKEEVTTDNIELLQKVEGTSLLETIEKALPQATLKVSALLEKALPKIVESKTEFDIREFVREGLSLIFKNFF